MSYSSISAAERVVILVLILQCVYTDIIVPCCVLRLPFALASHAAAAAVLLSNTAVQQSRVGLISLEVFTAEYSCSRAFGHLLHVCFTCMSYSATPLACPDAPFSSYSRITGKDVHDLRCHSKPCHSKSSLLPTDNVMVPHFVNVCMHAGQKPAVSFLQRPTSCWSKFTTLKTDYTKGPQAHFDM